MYRTYWFAYCVQPASARGIGVRVVSKWSEVPKRRPVIVQHYIASPYLINSSKFDLRIYVYVTCYDPLRIYVYDNGLARFASVKYVPPFRLYLFALGQKDLDFLKSHMYFQRFSVHISCTALLFPDVLF